MALRFWATPSSGNLAASQVYQDTEGKTALTITDGKVTGFTGAGKIRWVFATGSAASLAGKTFSYTLKSTGAGQWEANATSE